MLASRYVQQSLPVKVRGPNFGFEEAANNAAVRTAADCQVVNSCYPHGNELQLHMCAFQACTEATQHKRSTQSQ